MVMVMGQGMDRWDLWWSYNAGVSGPEAWGGFNLQWKLCGIGKRQSPIDIIPEDLLYDSNLKRISLDKHKVQGVLKNTGHDLTVEIPSSTHDVTLSDGPLGYSYTVYKIVIHFGSKDTQGSEHRIEGKAFPAEVQIVAYNNDLYPNSTSAADAHAGLAILSLMIGLNESSMTNLGDIIESASSVQYKGESKSLVKFSVHDLLPDTHNYMTYEGSVTRPGCLEIVTWIIMNKPVYITPEQLGLLRQTVNTEKDSSVKSPLYDNYRPVQSVNRRAVRTNINFPQQKSTACDFKMEKSYTGNPQILEALNPIL
ncbi:carbonic anhydrase-related protein 10-like [Watersipora subatra]|uniref:carbonic anhydrase-related protein 10-like n=1 Tax=Watersipora subatra TaxID=2589382 RepID=UPI00355C25C8